MTNRMKVRFAFSALVATLAGVALGAAGFDRLRDYVKVGGGTATTKTIEFDIGSGSNPKIVADGSTGLISFTANGGLAPVGAVMPYAGSSAPTGWLLCDGSAVSRTTYAALFAAIGTTYGTGDGSTTFNLPDLRGRAIAGKDDMGGSAASRLTNAGSGVTGTTLGATGGSQAYTPAGSIGGSQSIAHTHTISHYHQWGEHDSGDGAWYGRSSGSASTTSITTSDNLAFVNSSLAYASGSALAAHKSSAVFGSFYTTGALGAPSGSGSSAASGAMSANSTVNGSNFSFTGTASNTVQPTLVLNYLIKS